MKLLSVFFPTDIQPFTNDSNSRNNNSQGFQKFTNGYNGKYMSARMFLKKLQVTYKILDI